MRDTVEFTMGAARQGAAASSQKRLGLGLKKARAARGAADLHRSGEVGHVFFHTGAKRSGQRASAGEAPAPPPRAEETLADTTPPGRGGVSLGAEENAKTADRKRKANVRVGVPRRALSLLPLLRRPASSPASRFCAGQREN